MKIPVYLVTGFLGSGKTTFLDQILRQFDTKYRIGVVQNEFAPANIDGKALRSRGRSFEILEINNGSIFCICRMDDFTHSLAAFLEEKKPDLILIEASGLSDPASIVEIMQNPMLCDKVYLDKTWCIIDACHFLKVEKMMSRLKHQVLISDAILINKSDLAPEDNITQIREQIRQINPSAIVYLTSYCRIDHSLKGNEKGLVPQAFLRQAELQTVEQCRPDISVGVFKSGRRIKYEDLQDLIRATTQSTIRIKGNVLLADGQTALVQTVFRDIKINFAGDIYGTTCLVIMGENFNLSTFSRTFRELTL